MAIAELQGNQGVTDEGIAHVGHMSELKSLELQFCWQLTDAGVLHLQFKAGSAVTGHLLGLHLQLIMTMCWSQLSTPLVRHCIARLATDMTDCSC